MKGSTSKYLDWHGDDITLHIDAFWYGFAKLMQNVNGLYRLDMSGFNEYCEGVVKQLLEALLISATHSVQATMGSPPI